MIIEIIKVPAGVEPEFVRIEWKGLWLEACEKANCESALPSRTPPGENIYVDAVQALSILEKKSPKAAEWYYLNIPQEKINSFYFGPFSSDEYREV